MKQMLPQNSVVYGPMHSRRFGLSLGINLLPAGAKWCNFHCPYCQYSDQLTGPAHFLEAGALETELRAGFFAAKKQEKKIDSITIAGNGEPTLHPQFPEAVDAILRMRDEFFPGVAVSILSNSTTCHAEKVKAALLKLDQRFMKLDAGTPGDMVCMNAPSDQKAWEKVIRGLSGLGSFEMQSMFVEGLHRNTSPESVAAWVQKVEELKPRSVQIYTVQRPPQEGHVLPVALKRLEEIRSELEQATGIPAEVFTE